jgi:hypothetical protein
MTTRKSRAKASAAALEVVNGSKEQPRTSSDLLMPTLGELLNLTIPERQYLLRPWLREHESCLLYAATGVGKSLFALSAALAVAGGGSFLGWRPDDKADGGNWRVLYVDGEMHVGDIQERARLLLDAVPGISRTKVNANLQFLARQQQSPEAAFPEITNDDGQTRILQKVLDGKFDLLILDNFSTLGRVPDENAAASFDDVQSFLLRLKTDGVATMFVHHAGKTKAADGSGTFRGSSKLAATFEIMTRLERYGGDVRGHGRVEAAEQDQACFQVHWDKLRGQRTVGTVIAKLATTERKGLTVSAWDFTAQLERLYAIKAGLEAGLFMNQREIADYCERSPPTAKRDLERGVRHRLWTTANVHTWLAGGAAQRKAGKTQAPVRAPEAIRAT